MSLPTAADFSPRTWNRPLLGYNSKTATEGDVATVSFGLQAVVTCPVITPLCKGCYANGKGNYGFDSVKAGQARRLAVALTGMFRPRMIGELIAAVYAAQGEGANVLRLRLHDSGDFFDVSYIEDWIKILRDVNRISPIPVATWAPTRVWKADAIPVRIGQRDKTDPLPLLAELNAGGHTAIRPSALKVGVGPPKIEGLAAGHGVCVKGAVPEGYVCPVGAVHAHNMKRRRNPDLPLLEGSCAALKCRMCWGQATEVTFHKH